MAGRYHQLNGQEFKQTPRDSEKQGGLVCCSSWVTKSQSQRVRHDWATEQKILGINF